MKQRVSHGATLDVATPAEVAALIAERQDQQTDHDFHRQPGAINLDGTGAGSEVIKLGRMYSWLIERVALTVAAGAIVDFYQNQVIGSDLLETVTVGASGKYSDGFANKLFVPAGNALVVNCTGGAANGQLLYSLQIRQIKAQQGNA